jgi:hypothetical protein
MMLPIPEAADAQSVSRAASLACKFSGPASMAKVLRPVLDERLNDILGSAGHENGVAVGSGARSRSAAEGTAAATNVLNDEPTNSIEYAPI